MTRSIAGRVRAGKVELESAEPPAEGTPVVGSLNPSAEPAAAMLSTWEVIRHSGMYRRLAEWTEFLPTDEFRSAKRIDLGSLSHHVIDSRSLPGISRATCGCRGQAIAVLDTIRAAEAAFVPPSASPSWPVWQSNGAHGRFHRAVKRLMAT